MNMVFSVVTSNSKLVSMNLIFNVPSASIPPKFTAISSFHKITRSYGSGCFRMSASKISARDRVIDLGKYRGNMLGSLPSSYLKWVSKNLRAGDTEEWAKLADEVLGDAVYRDRIEWEFAENVLNGNAVNASSKGNDAVSELLEISERFGWDNEDKAGWSKIDFGLLGTSKGGRIPRLIFRRNVEPGRNLKTENIKFDEDGAWRRRERRERLRQLRDTRIVAATSCSPLQTRIGKLANGYGSRDQEVVKFGRTNDQNQRQDQERGQGRVIPTANLFPGRAALLNNVLLNRKRFYQ